ncbi:MAG: SAM-dependent methyltransferase [Dehalococcoidia bacterium]
MVDEAVAARLKLPAYPRSAAYDAEFMLETAMGPSVLWLAEALSAHLDLRPGMRVLDLGCGRAGSSIFFAKEFGVSVVAADLWIKPTENWARVQRFGLESHVMPISAEAHALPFADGYFDAIVSLDAYHYFGTDDLYAWTLARYLRPGGSVGIVVPGVVHEVEAAPAHLAAHWDPQFKSFHTPEWWRRHLEHTQLFDSVESGVIADGHLHWALWEEVRIAAGMNGPYGARTSSDDLDLLRADDGRTLLLQWLVAEKRT